jgi:hypothetical protein
MNYNLTVVGKVEKVEPLQGSFVTVTLDDGKEYACGFGVGLIHPEVGRKVIIHGVVSDSGKFGTTDWEYDDVFKWEVREGDRVKTIYYGIANPRAVPLPELDSIILFTLDGEFDLMAYDPKNPRAKTGALRYIMDQPGEAKICGIYTRS